MSKIKNVRIQFDGSEYVHRDVSDSLLKRLEELTAELNSAKAEIERCKASSVMDGFAIIDLQRQVAELKGALDEYGNHRRLCRVRMGPMLQCDCGFQEALRKLFAPDQKE